MGDDQAAMAKACTEGDLSAAKSLLESGPGPFAAPVSWKDSDGKDLNTPPLFIAVDFERIDIVKAFLDAGAQIDQKDDNGYTPLHWASWNGSVDLVRLLLERGAEADDEALSLAKEFERKEVVDVLMGKIDLYSHLEGDADAVMDKACREGDVAKVKEMIAEGYDYAKWKDEDGKYQQFSPMYMAVKFGHMDVVQVFAEAGVEAETQQ